MDTETSRFGGRRGVAMFVVLGTIIVVSLLGFVGLSLAGKDQSASGDFADLQSTDQVGLAGLQLAVNRLTANPANMVTQINAFISDTKSHSSTLRSWLNLKGTNVQAVSTNPGWDSLSSTAGDQSAVEVQILAVALGPDTATVPAQDSEAIYIALQCSARGRHGDLRTVQGTYLVHGVSLAFTQTIDTVVVPTYAFYVGGSLSSSNLQAAFTGTVYVGGTGGTYINSNTMTIHGNFKWNGDLKVNAPLSVDSNAYINGGLSTNGSAPLTVGGNLGVAKGFQTMNSSVTVSGNMWVGDTGTNSNWNSGVNLIVGGNLVLWPSGNFTMGGGTSLKVGGNAWLMSGLNKSSYNVGDSVSTQGSMYITDLSAAAFGFTQQNSSGVFYVKRNLVSNTGSLRTLTFNNATGRITDSMYISNNGTLSLTSALTVDSSNHAYFYHLTTSGGGKLTVKATNYTNGMSYTTGTHANYVTAPTAMALGLDTEFQKTAVNQNAMDSVVVTTAVSSHMITLTSSLMTAANAGSVMTPASMSRLYTYLDSLGELYDGYMILDLTSSSSTIVSNGTDNSGTGFVGKAMFIVDASFSVNGNWPHSQDSTDIQIIDIRGSSGALENWGWTYGNFSGIFYWQNPPCGGHNLKLPSTGTWTGAFLMGTSVPACPPYSPLSLTPNSSSIVLRTSTYVFSDIGKNLPGIIKAGVNADGTTNASKTTVATSITSPYLRQVTDKPFFEAVGVYR